MSLLRDFLAGRPGRRSGPDPVVVVRDVGHRVFIRRTPEEVWQHLLEPDPGAELGVDCVRVLPLPLAGDTPTRAGDLAAVWRRSNGRLWVGLSTVEVEPGVRVVSRATDGGVALALTTTVEPLDDGCVVAQQLEGIEPTDPVAEFARAWLARALLGLKADVEGTPRSRPRDPLADDPLGAGLGGPLGSSLGGQPGAANVGSGVVPVHESASVEVAVAPDRLWQLLDVPAALASRAAGPAPHRSLAGTERLMRVELADEPGRAHVLAVHARPDGRRAASVSLVVEATPPARIVQRDLTSAHETDVVTTVEPCDGAARLTEIVTGWLPAGTGQVTDPEAAAHSLRSRLAVVKQLAEGDAEPPRNPRTGFLPPGESAAPPPPNAPSAPTGPTAPSLPSSVLLPPPHVAAPAAGHDVGPWPVWGDEGFFVAAEAEWW